MLGSWFLAREAELAGARACLLTVLMQDSPVVEWALPVSKTDVEALGVARAHACCCLGGPPRPLCPAHAAWDHLLHLRRTFPGRHQGGQPDRDLPLFPDQLGRPVRKELFVATIVRAAELLQVELVSADGSERVSGHSLRPTGAQGLTRLGVDIWAVQLLGRWGSSTVQTYVRDASVSAAAAVARRQAVSHNLRTLLRSATSDLDAGASDLEESLAMAVRRLLSEYGQADRPSTGAELTDAVRLASVTEACSSRGASTASSSSSSLEECHPRGTGTPDPPVGSGADSSSAEGALQVVANQVTGVVHKVVIGPPCLDASSWCTLCGWRFGLQFGHRQAAGAPAPGAPRCRRCWRS